MICRNRCLALERNTAIPIGRTGMIGHCGVWEGDARLGAMCAGETAWEEDLSIGDRGDKYMHSDGVSWLEKITIQVLSVEEITNG